MSLVMSRCLLVCSHLIFMKPQRTMSPSQRIDPGLPLWTGQTFRKFQVLGRLFKNHSKLSFVWRIFFVNTRSIRHDAFSRSPLSFLILTAVGAAGEASVVALPIDARPSLRQRGNSFKLNPLWVLVVLSGTYLVVQVFPQIPPRLFYPCLTSRSRCCVLVPFLQGLGQAF